MPMVNAIRELAQSKGCENAYQFWKLTGLPQPTAYRLFQDATAYPSKENQEVICKTFDCQPGDFLRYVPQQDTEE